jgi:hypothetical protein
MSKKKPETKSARPSQPPKGTAAGGTSSATPAIRRRDATGHLEPHYAADLLAKSREGRETSEQEAFVHGSHSDDDLAEELAEEAVGTMTSGEYEAEDMLDQVVEEEKGGPFVESTAGQEYAEGTDLSNPSTATREPFPKT